MKYNCKIDDYGYICEKVKKINGKVCFIPYVLEGELCACHVIKDTHSFLRAEVEELLSLSKERVIPLCPYYKKCGGCVLQHTNYQNQLKIKEKILLSHLRKIDYSGKIEVFASPKSFKYRNKIKLFCKNGNIGLKKENSNEVVDIERCLICEDEINTVICKVRTFVSSMNLCEDIENIIVRHEEGKALVWFKLKRNIDVNFQGLQIMLGSNCGIFTSIKDGRPKHELGLDKLVKKDYALNCEYRVNSFKQINNEVAEKLYQEVILNIKGTDVINAYSGAGLLSGAIVKNKKTCYAIELGLSEHQDAEDMKLRNNLNKLFNFHGDCKELLPQIVSEYTQTIVLDPPRIGCDKKVIEVINSSKVKRVIYISCNPATLVRDIQRMDKYELKKIKLFDMFPETSSMECLAVLEEKNSNLK